MPPFACTADPAFTALLVELGCALALSTYQAGKLILVGADGDGLVQLPRSFPRPMGLAVEGRRMALAAGPQVVVLVNSPALAPGYPRAPNTYDALYLPQAIYPCGPLDLHDLAWAGDELLAVNTRCSCICRIDQSASFTPLWRPPFISSLAPEDRCHLNGMALAGDTVRYATALSVADTPRGYRPHKLTGGVLLVPPDGAVAIGGLAMPHSPRLVGDRLLLLISAEGLLVEADPVRGRYEPIVRLPAFVRGLAHHAGYLFVGMSRLRPDRPLGDIPLARQELQAGVAAIELASGRLVGALRYLRDCEEIYDVQVLPGVRRPGVIGLEGGQGAIPITLPDGGYWITGQG